MTDQTQAARRDGIPSAPARSRTRDLVAAALIAAIMAALGPVSIEAGAVPVTLQIFPVVLAGLLLSPGWAAASMAVYVLLGLVGVPVFAHYTAGVGVLAGPTGGYLIGFVVGAAAGAFVRTRVERVSAVLADISAALVTILVVYGVGCAWLAFGPTHLPPLAAFVGGVVPFLVPDTIKATVAVLIATAVRRGLSAA